MLTMRVEESRQRTFGTLSSRHISPSSDISAETYRHAVGNVAARMRTLLTYFEANLHDRLVLGIGNQIELILGYFTKYGDGDVDPLPIGDLYKSHVWELGSHLGIPEAILEKPPIALRIADGGNGVNVRNSALLDGLRNPCPMMYRRLAAMLARQGTVRVRSPVAQKTVGQTQGNR